ncbi:MAG: DEAD/DEAH box helicase [Deltaproteobacteria bacterium]|nr:DEAD/DEAH box helicase [Deltaproteobacteria bacterium]
MSAQSSPEERALDSLAPLARQWFVERFGRPTIAQVLAWPLLATGRNGLLVAPTGSGKTLAAFLQPLGRLADEALSLPRTSRAIAEPSKGIRVLYISPLRALDADIHHNLHAPLDGISALARASGIDLQISHAMRTGDTSARDRRASLKSPPHVLITTPESLFVLLGNETHRASLSHVELVIVDELHAIADSKRGTHLALSLERLDALCAKPVQRLGVTATAEPLVRLAQLLCGQRDVEVLDGRRARVVDLRVELAPRAKEAKGDVRVARVAAHVRRAQRSIVFVGSRMLAERFRPSLERELAESTPAGETPLAIGIHHGALAKEVRVVVEAGLRDGGLCAVVATSSLELGIDVGAIDMVVQVGAPGSVAALLQRVGRAGHSPGATPRGVVVSSGGMDLLECAVTARCALDQVLEEVRIPQGALDVLAQQVVAHAASFAEPVAIDDFLAMARKSDPYRDLTRESLLRVIEALASERHRAPRLTLDRARSTITAPEVARNLARIAGGTITSRGLYRMLDADSRETLGELDEEFVHESRVGDRFTFGLGVYRVVTIRPDAVLVRRAPPGSARMPFWRGDRPMRAEQTGLAIGAVLREIEPILQADQGQAVAFFRERFPVDERTAEACVEEIATQARATPLPTDRRVVVERYTDALGEVRIAVHAFNGRAVLEPWALALAARIEARLGGAVHVASTDNGLLFAPPKELAISLTNLLAFVGSTEVRALIESIAPRTAIVGAAFREAAERSLLLPRLPYKKRTPLWMNRQRARDLLLSIGDDPTHPLLVEALREVLDDRWSMRALTRLLGEIERNEVEVCVVERRSPSPFARLLERAFTAENLYEDDTPSAERAARRADSSGGDVGAGSFEYPLTLDGIAEPADKGVLGGLSLELPLPLIVLRAQGPVAVHDLAMHMRIDEGALRLALAPAIAAGQLVVGRFSSTSEIADTLEICDAEILARLRRKALSRARRQIEPVSRRAYQRWLLERQRVGPFAGEGDDAVAQAMEGLWMYPAPPESLERDLLRVRVTRYDPSWLDLSCARGELRYVLLESPARIVLGSPSGTEPFPAPTRRTEGPRADAVRETLSARGALFAADLSAILQIPVSDIESLLLELLRGGEVCNDSFAAARACTLGITHRKTGRWSLRPTLHGDPSPDALIARVLARYGVVARPLVDREELAPAWGAMREELDRRESRGEVRRGEIIEGLGPVQFARTETIESLRSSRTEIEHAAVLLSVRDPALVHAIEGLTRAASTRVIVRDGECLAVVERDGLTIRTLRDLHERDLHSVADALRSLARLPAALRPMRTLTVERVDDAPASQSALGIHLVSEGFERDGARVTLSSFRA